MENNDNCEVKKLIKCSFCEKGRNQVSQMIEGPIFHNNQLFICDECSEEIYHVLHTEDPVVDSKKKKTKLLNPEQIKEHLDLHIVGQDHAKIAISVAVYNHFKRINNKSKVEIEKSNVLMVGSSGSGKTLTVKTVAKLFDLPYIIADATSLTEAGYVGEDVDSLIKRLIHSADGDLEKAKHGIIFIDEIDKKSRKSDVSLASRDVSGEGVQQALLKMIEGAVIKIEDGFDDQVDFDTKDILFICSGAFVGLDETIRKNQKKTSIGIGASITTKVAFSDTVKTATPEDFIKYGLIPEFVGRCPVIIVFDDVTPDMLIRILKEPANSITNQYKALFKIEGITLEFDDKYLLNVAEQCLIQKIGARGLRTVMERDLQATQFILPRLAKEGVNKILVEANAIKHIHKVKKRANNE